MSDLPLLTWALVLAALVLGILAGHFGWGKRWPGSSSNLHPDYLTGLDYLVTEQPDRALDMFLKLMDANADTIETHFALGALYRRRGEVERAIRIHQNLLAREDLASEHREQALLALAQDYLRAGVLDRAEGLFQQVSEVARLRVSALDALRGVYERQHDWQQALGTYRQLARIKAAPARTVAAHYLCELASLAIERGDIDEARTLLRDAREEATPFPRAALLSAQIAEREAQPVLAVRLLRAGTRRIADSAAGRTAAFTQAGRRRAARCHPCRTRAAGRLAGFGRVETPGICGDRGRPGIGSTAARFNRKGVFRGRDIAGRVAGRTGAARAHRAGDWGAVGAGGKVSVQ